MSAERLADKLRRPYPQVDGSTAGAARRPQVLRMSRAATARRTSTEN